MISAGRSDSQAYPTSSQPPRRRPIEVARRTRLCSSLSVRCSVSVPNRESASRIKPLYRESTENNPKKHAERQERYREDPTLLPPCGKNTRPEKRENAKHERESGGLRLGVEEVVSNVEYSFDNEQKASIEWFDAHIPVWIVQSRAAIKSHRSIFDEGAEETDMREIYDAIATEVS